MEITGSTSLRNHRTPLQRLEVLPSHLFIASIRCNNGGTLLISSYTCVGKTILPGYSFASILSFRTHKKEETRRRLKYKNRHPN